MTNDVGVSIQCFHFLNLEKTFVRILKRFNDDSQGSFGIDANAGISVGIRQGHYIITPNYLIPPEAGAELVGTAALDPV